MVSEPVTVSSWRDCTTKHALETACLAEAGWQFTQANQTPCFQSLIWEIFGEMGICRLAFNQVLEGTFEPPDSCDQYTKKVFAHLKWPESVRQIDSPSLAEYIYSWCHARKEMSLSYSAVHFGHYIAGMYDTQITQFNAYMATLLASMGYSPSRWRHGLNVMLEKSPGTFDMERLCIILLFEADCNHNNKWLGQAFMKEVEWWNLLADEQYGSQHYKDAITQCLNKRLWYDYIHCTHQPAVLCSNDAKSC